jgi:hypothetical protein
MPRLRKAVYVSSYAMRHLAFVLSLFLIGCSDRESQNQTNDTRKKNNEVIRDSSLTTRLSTALHLPKIEKGVDSFELRLWSSLSMTDLQILTTLRFSDGLWHCTQSRYWIGAITEWGKNRSLYVDSVETRKVVPTIPYKDLLDTIRRYHITNIPSQQDIPGFVDRTADGMVYVLEIAESNKYYSITYRNPQTYDDSANKKISSLLSFLNRSISAFTIL